MNESRTAREEFFMRAGNSTANDGDRPPSAGTFCVNHPGLFSSFIHAAFIFSRYGP
jgi:hypothetical protein